MFAMGVGPVIDLKPVVAVDVEIFKTDQEPLQDGFGLEGDHAIHIPLIFGHNHGSINGAWHVLPEIVVTPLAKGADGH